MLLSYLPKLVSQLARLIGDIFTRWGIQKNCAKRRIFAMKYEDVRYLLSKILLNGEFSKVVNGEKPFWKVRRKDIKFLKTICNTELLIIKKL